jgi:hypothetical protein
MLQHSTVSHQSSATRLVTSRSIIRLACSSRLWELSLDAHAAWGRVHLLRAVSVLQRGAADGGEPDVIENTREECYFSSTSGGAATRKSTRTVSREGIRENTRTESPKPKISRSDDE